LPTAGSTLSLQASDQRVVDYDSARVAQNRNARFLRDANFDRPFVGASLRAQM
jgi:hypothetical protein